MKKEQKQYLDKVGDVVANMIMTTDDENQGALAASLLMASIRIFKTHYPDISVQEFLDRAADISVRTTALQKVKSHKEYDRRWTGQ